MSTATEPVWLKVGQVAKALQLSESSVYRMVMSGRDTRPLGRGPR